MPTEIPELTTIPFVGGGPLHGHRLAMVSGPEGISYVVDEDSSTLPHFAPAALDCYESAVEDGERVLRYNRAKGEAWGYTDREGDAVPLYRKSAAPVEPQWIPDFDPAPDGVHEPMRVRDEGRITRPAPPAAPRSRATRRAACSASRPSSALHAGSLQLVLATRRRSRNSATLQHRLVYPVG